MVINKGCGVARAWLACLIFFAGGASAQTWPDRPVRIVNPYASGGPSDIVARLLADRLSAELGQRVFVESKPGGGTVIGANLGAEITLAGPDEFAAYVKNDERTLVPVIRALGLTNN